MRVRISYGLDIKDVPTKVREIMYDSLEEMRVALSLIESCSREDVLFLIL